MAAPPIHNPMDKLPAEGRSPSLRLHIDAMCAHCMGCMRGYQEPGFRDQIRDCSAPDCPLWPIRPYQNTKGYNRSSKPDEDA